MYGDGDSKVYVVFRDEMLEDIDSEWNLEVHWAGGATFNVYSAGRAVDCFTRYGDNQGHAPTFDQAWKAADEFFVETRSVLFDSVVAEIE